MRWITRTLLALGWGCILLGLVIGVVELDAARLIFGAVVASPARLAGHLLVIGGVLAVAFRNTGKRKVTVRRMTGAGALVFGGIRIFGIGDAWSTEHVRFASQADTLDASLYMPRRIAPPWPAVVIVHGSAPFRRGFYEPWARRIANAGFAVLLADKRGVGPSGGTFERENNSSRENLERLAEDAIAGVAYLRTRDDIDRGRIGLVGLSQAGWTAPIAAARDSSIAFVALISGPTVSVREEGVWSRLRGEDQSATSVPVDSARAMVDTTRPGGVDARDALAVMRQPGLWLFGADDNSIPTTKSMRVLDSLAALGKPFIGRSFDGYGHLVIGRGGQRRVPHLAPAALDTLVAWLRLRRLHAPTPGA